MFRSVFIFLICLSTTYELVVHKKCIKSCGYRNGEKNISARVKRNVNTPWDSYQPPSISPKFKDLELEITKCFEEPKLWCNDQTRYRSIDGRCNNLKTRSWGMANTAMFRVVAAQYVDNICSIRNNNESPLPSALKIAHIISNSEAQQITEAISKFFAVFAQIIAEDVASIIIKPSDKNLCCSNTINNTSDHPSCDCMATFIPQSASNCSQFIRSKTTYSVECPVFPVFQLSSTSSFLDASFLYSTDSSGLAILRANKKGKLKVQTDGQRRPFLKTYKSHKNITYDTDRSAVHVNTGTQILQTMFLRLHNFLCDVLSWLNPYWDDEVLFNEARRLLIAMYQHIVYYEFLPIVIGYEYAKKFDLMPKRSKLQESYDPTINPTTINSFSTAAFRFFHAFIPSSIELLDKDYKHVKNISFATTAENFDFMENDWYDSFIRGSIKYPLFQTESLEMRKRLLIHSIDVERVRDHGLRSYNDYREACGLYRIYDFKQLENLMNPKDVMKLEEIYSDEVDDIELYIGGILETPVKDAMVGPTFQCLIAEGFYRYKYGDRFFYEHKSVMGQFNKEQLQEIKKVTASLLICLSSDAIQKVQSNVFYLPSIANPYIPCEIIMRPDYTWWLEKPGRPKHITK